MPYFDLPPVHSAQEQADSLQSARVVNSRMVVNRNAERGCVEVWTAARSGHWGIFSEIPTEVADAIADL